MEIYNMLMHWKAQYRYDDPSRNGWIDSVQSHSQSRQAFPLWKVMRLIYLERQRTKSSQNDVEKEESWQTYLPDFKTYYKATTVKTEG